MQHVVVIQHVIYMLWLSNMLLFTCVVIQLVVIIQHVAIKFNMLVFKMSYFNMSFLNMWLFNVLWFFNVVIDQLMHCVLISSLYLKLKRECLK